MSFALPAMKPSADATSKWLRDIEQNAPKNTEKEIRGALLQAAKELEAWHKLAADTARQLDEAANIRVGQMDSLSRVDEKQRGVKSTLLELARRFRELA